MGTHYFGLRRRNLIRQPKNPPRASLFLFHFDEGFVFPTIKRFTVQIRVRCTTDREDMGMLQNLGSTCKTRGLLFFRLCFLTLNERQRIINGHNSDCFKTPSGLYRHTLSIMHINGRSRILNSTSNRHTKITAWLFVAAWGQSFTEGPWCIKRQWRYCISPIVIF